MRRWWPANYDVNYQTMYGSVEYFSLFFTIQQTYRTYHSSLQVCFQQRWFKERTKCECSARMMWIVAAIYGDKKCVTFTLLKVNWVGIEFDLYWYANHLLPPCVYFTCAIINLHRYAFPYKVAAFNFIFVQGITNPKIVPQIARFIKPTWTLLSGTPCPWYLSLMTPKNDMVRVLSSWRPHAISLVP